MARLISLQVKGFGKFDSEKKIEFKKGINFITGLNETGKSTILEALLASIFKYTKNQIEKFKNWSHPDICSLTLVYATEKNEIFSIKSDYIANKRKLIIVENGKPNEFSTADKVIDQKIKEHFGFDEQKVFENTAFIRQSQMAILEEKTEKTKMKDMIEEVFVGRAESSATKALKKINEAIKEYKKEEKILSDRKKGLKIKFDEASERKTDISTNDQEKEDVLKKLAEKSILLEKLKKNKGLFDEKDRLTKGKNDLEKRLQLVDEIIGSRVRKKDAGLSFKTVMGIACIAIGAIAIAADVILKFAYPGLSAEYFYAGIIVGIMLLFTGTLALILRKKSAAGIDSVDKDINYEEERKVLLTQIGKIEGRLEDERLKLVNFTIDDFDEIENIEKDVEGLRERKTKLETSIEITKDLSENPDDIKESLQLAEDSIDDLNTKIEEHTLAVKFLEQADAEVREKFTPSIEDNADSILNKITNGKYSKLAFDRQTMDISVLAPEDNRNKDVSLLSQGARDQVYFSLRTAMADLLGGGANLPLFLDDPFHNFDDIRLGQTISMIKEISKSKQVIVISHRPYHEVFDGFSDNTIILS